MKDITELNGAKEYKRMEDSRQPFLDRAKEASKLTIPQLYPEITEDSHYTNYPSPYQSLGARGTNNLANKMILSLFPPATAFFKLGMNQLAQEQSGVSEGDLQTAMYKIEKAIVDEMEVSQLRSALVEILKQGTVGGSAILHIAEEGEPKFYNLNEFVIKRSKSGKVLKLIIQENINILELDDDIVAQLEDLDDKERKGEKDLKVYTIIALGDDKKYHVVQEIKGIKIKGSKGSYREEELPYIFVPFVDRKENYGRSYVEDFIGDLQSYEGLRQAILEASSEAARLIYLVRPNAIITPKNLENARSGDVLLGNPDDVAVLQADKRLDVSMAQQEAEVLRTDLATAFLLDSAVRRNAERVTAEEIRRVSQELEVALGGIYSTLANVLQEPLVRLYLKRLVKKGFIKNILKENIKLEITTGSAALGRGTEFRAIQEFASFAATMLGEAASQYLNVPEFLSRAAYSLDVNTGDLVKTKEQLEAEAAQAQQRQLEQQAVGPAINAANQQELAKQQGN